MTVVGTKPHPIFLAGRWVESPDVARDRQPGRRRDARRRDLQRDRGPVRGGGRGRRRGVRGHPQAARLRARRILREISAGLKARREELGRLIALESGKPIRDALIEVDRAALTFRLGAEEAERITGEVIPLDLIPASKDRVGITRRFPIGPIAGISPFNFPLNLAAHKIAPAIAAGNPIVLKPPSKDPLTMLRSPRSSRRPACRPGAVSILPMTRELGDRMVADPRFKLLTFTGSPSVGWRMKERAGKKKVVLELGGNAGVIVDKTANLDWAVKRCLVGAFTYAGQVCISVQRMFVHEDVWDPFMDAFVAGREGTQGRRPARPDHRPRPDGRRARRPVGPSAGSTRRWRWAASSSSAAQSDGASSRRRS